MSILTKWFCWHVWSRLAPVWQEQRTIITRCRKCGKIKVTA